QWQWRIYPPIGPDHTLASGAVSAAAQCIRCYSPASRITPTCARMPDPWTSAGVPWTTEPPRGAASGPAVTAGRMVTVGCAGALDDPDDGALTGRRYGSYWPCRAIVAQVSKSSW